MGGPKVDKSAPTPLYLFYGTRSSLSSSVSTDNTTVTTKTTKEKTRGKTADGAICMACHSSNDY